MHKRCGSFLLRFTRQFIVFSTLLIVLTSSSFAATTDTELRLGVANPGEVPNFDDFAAPTIIPGTTGKLKFTITNRYTFNDDNNMINVSLVLNIHRYVTLEESKDVKKISHGPKIVSGNDALLTIRDQFTVEFYWQKIAPNETVPVEISIKSSSESPEGTYFVRMHINFTFNGTYFEMKSRGHFTNAQWEHAQPNANETDEYPIVGRLDLVKLGVGGIIPDTSFRVKEPIPLWPFYVGVGLAISFLILAGVFYFMDEKGKFPETKRKLDDFGEKVSNFRYRRR